MTKRSSRRPNSAVPGASHARPALMVVLHTPLSLQEGQR